MFCGCHQDLFCLLNYDVWWLMQCCLMVYFADQLTPEATLKPDGIVLANLWSEACNVLYTASLASYLAAFPPHRVRVLTPPHSGNRIVIASRTDFMARQSATVSDEIQRILRTSLVDAATDEPPIRD